MQLRLQLGGGQRLSIHDLGVEKSEDRDCLKKCKPHLVWQGVRALKEGITSITEEFTKVGCMCSKVCIHHLKISQIHLLPPPSLQYIVRKSNLQKMRSRTETRGVRFK